MDTIDLPEIFQLETEQCGNQTAYGLPGSLYCGNYKNPGFEWCKPCCENILADHPETNTHRRDLPYEHLVLHTTSGDIFVWPQRGQEGEEQRGSVFVFGHESAWARQVRHGRLSLSEYQEGGSLSEWDDVIHVYESPFREASGDVHGFPYSMESLREIAALYGKPVADRT